MGFDINWGLSQGPNPFGMALQGFEYGRQMGEEHRRRNAFAAYAQNPDDPKNFPELARADPEFAMQERRHQQQAQAQAQHQQLAQRAAQGDPEALNQLAGADTDLWMKLDGHAREKAKQATSFMSQAGMDVSRLPEEQRAGAWANYVRQAEASGMDIPPQYENYSPQALNSAMAEAGAMEKLIKQFEPDWRAVPQGGYLENVNPLSNPGVGQGPHYQAPMQQAQPQAPPAMDPATLQAQAAEAIRNGADPAAVNARLQQMLGGAGQQAPHTFP